MDTRTRQAAYRALCRLLEAQSGLAAIAVYERRGNGYAIGHATESYRALMRPGARPRLDPDLPALDGTGSTRIGPAPGGPEPVGRVSAGPVSVDPERLGLDAAMALVQPLPSGPGGRSPPAGFVAAASRSRRRIAGRIAEALRDASIVGGQLVRLRGLDGGLPHPVPRGAAAPPAADLAAAGSTEAAAGRGGPAEPVRTPTRAVETGSGQSAAGGVLPPPDPVPVCGAIAALSRAAVHQLIASILRARSRGEPLALVILDIDRFRAVNEALGSEAGDGALAAIGARLEAAMPPNGRLIRLEGDRFLVVASSARQTARGLATRLLTVVAEPLDLPMRRLTLRASAGAVQAARGESSPVRLLMEADGALRRAKLDGGGRVELHEPDMHAAVLDRSRLELDLRHALEAGQFSMVYQPIVELASGRVTGAEALLRWHHPTRGEIAPTTFIPLAEASGHILPIGTWALHTACAEAARWPGDFRLAVNISPLQFHAPGFVERVDAVLAATGFPAARLELEITETVLMRDNPETTAQLRAMIDRGIRIALDDFGTGYSALAYLSRLPHHRIKLDKSFVQDLARPSTTGLVRAIIALARGGGIETTAEGVERPEQVEAVKAMGFTHAQGFATGTPMRDLARLHEAAGCD